MVYVEIAIITAAVMGLILLLNRVRVWLHAQSSSVTFFVVTCAVVILAGCSLQVQDVAGIGQRAHEQSQAQISTAENDRQAREAEANAERDARQAEAAASRAAREAEALSNQIAREAEAAAEVGRAREIAYGFSRSTRNIGWACFGVMMLAAFAGIIIMAVRYFTQTMQLSILGRTKVRLAEIAVDERRLISQENILTKFLETADVARAKPMEIAAFINWTMSDNNVTYAEHGVHPQSGIYSGAAIVGGQPVVYQLTDSEAAA